MKYWTIITALVCGLVGFSIYRFDINDRVTMQFQTDRYKACLSSGNTGVKCSLAEKVIKNEDTQVGEALMMKDQ